MKHIRNHRRVWLLAAAVLCVTVFAAERSFLSADVSDCVGKPYGTPGCPILSTQQGQVSSTQSLLCGNGIVDDGEECDKGRFNGKTECSDQCTWLYCGDGVLSKELGEECEPKTQQVYVLDGDGQLVTETQFAETQQCGWYCVPPQCESDGTCHDGCKLRLYQACTSSSSAPSVQLSISESSSPPTTQVLQLSSSSATSAAFIPVVFEPKCGDFVLDPGEQCDDGNGSNDDRCSVDCRLTGCGDGYVQTGEECDDGNLSNGDDCTNTCRYPRCGDGFTQSIEECDDGNTDNTDHCTNDCKIPRCGDGIRQEPEQCDDGARNSDTQRDACRTSCRRSYCGDSVVDATEECDMGLRNAQTTPDACRLSCKLPRCGDGVVDAAEECDDGNADDTDQCTNLCKKAHCGDGILQRGEDCDWGARNSNQIPDACRMDCRSPRCGDGVVDVTEECDGGSRCTGICTLVAGTTEAHSSSDSVADGTGTDGDLHLAAEEKSMASAIAAGGSAAVGVFLVFLWFYLRGNRVLSSLFGKHTLDDVPLDQIEMPYHRW